MFYCLFPISTLVTLIYDQILNMNKLISRLIYVAILLATTVIVLFVQPQLVYSLSPTPKAVQKLTPNDGAAGDLFGRSLAIGGDYGLIGAPYKDDKGIDSGAAYLFDLKSGQQLRKLTASDAKAGDLFGLSVAATDDYALVGAGYQDGLGIDSGTTYLFSTETGQQLRKLVANDLQAGDVFGFSVAIEGEYALVSAAYKDVQANDSGAAYLFNLDTGEQLQKFIPTDGRAGDVFGYDVAIAGNYGLIGAPYQDERGSDSGVAYVFDLTTGKQLYKLVASDGKAGSLFGYSVALINDTDSPYALIGAAYEDSKGKDNGSVYLFDLNTGKQLEKFVAEDNRAGDLFGSSVGMSDNYALVGASHHDAKGADSGAAYLFDLSNKNQLAKFTADDGSAGDLYGSTVEMKSNYGLIGAPYDDGKSMDSGSVYFLKFET